MNILYIGPYRQIDYVGQMANLHIDSIKKSIKNTDRLLTRPIYFDTSLVSSSSDNYSSESTDIDNIDTVIQYVPIDFIAIDRDVKNIVIPMIDPKIQNISQDSTYDVLNNVDKIILDDEKNKNLIKNYGIKTPIEMYEEKIIDNKKQKFNLDAINTSYKFGFIGQYFTNKQIIKKIIHSFLLCYRQRVDSKLHLFLRGSDKDKADLDESISNIKKDLKIPDYISCVNSVFGIWGKDDALAALNSINCYLSINDDYRYLIYERFFTSSLTEEKDRFIINRQNVDCVETPVASLNNLYEYNNSISSINTQDLYRKMVGANAAPATKHKKTENLSLGSILCKQVL